LGDEIWHHALFYDFVSIECDLYTTEETYDFGKKGYEAGWIHFTVPVNTHITDLSDTSKALVDDETIVDVDCILKLPESYTATGDATKVIMITHGAGRGVWTQFGDQVPWKDIDTYNALVDTFVDAGYAVFDCSGYGNDAYGVNFWGCPRGLQAWYKAYEYVEKYYNVTPKIGLYGFSMGGCTAFNLINKAFPNIACVGLGSPVTNLAQDQVSNMGYFLDAYGMGSSYDASKVVGYNPLENIVEIDNEEYCFKTLPPIKVWFGANETWPAPTDAQRLCNAIKKGGGVADYRLVDDAGHEVCYGGIPAINTEILYWFNRFSYSEDE
jgi:dipeptidyl aminopeptidase/acylaminoacyl peptidase